MPTRGKSEGKSEIYANRTQLQDPTFSTAEMENNDVTRKTNSSPQEKTTYEEKESVKSISSSKSRRTPSVAGSETTSPVLNNVMTSRSSTRRAALVMDISSEDTPLSFRQTTSASESRSKRLKLYPTEIEESKPRKRGDEDSNSGDEKVREFPTTRDERYHINDTSDGETTKHDDQSDGVRRSTRPRKQIYDFSMNASWIFGGKTAKGYPKIQPEENSLEVNSQIRTRRRGPVVEEEEAQEGEDEDEGVNGHDDENDDDAIGNRLRKSNRIRMTSPIKGQHPSHGLKFSNESSKVNDDMYSRIKNTRRSLRSSNRNDYSGYTSTVRNARKATGNMKRRSRYETPSDDTDPEISESESDTREGEVEETQVAVKTKRSSDRGNRNEETEMLPIVDGKMKGRYTLRKIQPIDRYRPLETLPSSRSRTPPRSRSTRHSSRIACSPAHRSSRKRRQKAQNESSTSSSSSDDERFERRKNKSMIKARNRCLPMNFSPDEFGQGVVKDRMKIGSSLADVDPMKIDNKITFEEVGGLETYIQSLKEMVLFPLLYPEVFEKFSIQAPRGVLFYGPPGTGKTLVARCLANECSQKDRRVAFFMRKGADCLSKWVGESERQLRLLFDQAYQMRPSIIFFDEIDGLAPVRSTRQDQIHSSIVSTLLALMDGLDSRGEVIIIGATNRLDAIDPALRRPGRFDREFHFPLPSLSARKEILDIHLKSWIPSPPANLVNYLSQKTVGYCGADLKALCAEAALLALRRRYPQVYKSRHKLLLDMSQIKVERKDFDGAVQRLVPASQRSAVASGKPLSITLAPLLFDTLQALIKHVQVVFPEGMNTLKMKGPVSGAKKQTSNQLFPRLMIAGDSAPYITSALLHHMERLPVHRLDLSTLNGLSVRSPEEACVQLFHEARRNVPAIIYLPLVSRWWQVTSESVRATFLTQLKDLDPELPILVLATNDDELGEYPDDLCDLFQDEEIEIFKTPAFTGEERRKFFRPLFLKCLKEPFVRKPLAYKTEILPLAPAPPPRQLNEVEKDRLEKKEEATLRELRIFLREILAKMARNKLFYMFTRPVDINEVPDYRDVIRQPMDLETMMTKIDLHAYESAKDFLSDIELICSNALEYNPDRDPEDKMIRHRACTLRDTAYALIKAEMDTDFEEQCQEISKTRKARQEKPLCNAPLSTQSDETTNGTATVHSLPKENGMATDVEIKATRSRPRKGSGWSRRTSKKCLAKKKKAEEDAEEAVNNDSSAVQVDASATSEKIDQTPELGSSKNVVNDDDSNLLGETIDDAQTSDALDMDETQTMEQTPCENSATASKKAVIIENSGLEKFFESLVIHTEHWRLEKLLRLYSKLARLIDRYAKLWDRSALLEEMEHMLRRTGETTR